MPAHLRVSLPDRPGALAALTRALAAAGANVHAVTVVQREAGRAVDDLLLDWPFERPWDGVVRAVEACPGARMHGLRHVAEVSRSQDADVLLQVARQPHRGLETLVDALPSLLLADWAAIADQRWPRDAVVASADAPAPLPVTPVPLPRSRVLTAADAPLLVLPCGDDRSRLVVGRSQPPGFTRSELDRCAALLAATLAVARLGSEDRPGAAVS